MSQLLHLLPWVTIGSLVVAIVISFIGLHVEERRDLDAQYGWVMACQLIGLAVAVASFAVYVHYMA